MCFEMPALWLDVFAFYSDIMQTPSESDNTLEWDGLYIWKLITVETK